MLAHIIYIDSESHHKQKVLKERDVFIDIQFQFRHILAISAIKMIILQLGGKN